MNFRNSIRLVIAAALAGTFAASANAADPGITDDEITIGLFAPMSGPLAAFGFDPLQTAKMIYDEKNKAGGVHGRKFKILAEDDRCDTAQMQTVVRQFVSVDKVFLLHGGSCTAGTQALQEYVTREKVPLIVLNAGADGAVFPPTRYVFGGNTGTQASNGGAFIQFATKGLNGKHIALLLPDDDIGTAIWRTAKAAAQKAGVEIAAYERIPSGTTDVTATMLKVRLANPDVIIAITYPQLGVLITQKYGEFGMTAPLVLGIQTIPNAKVFAANVGNNAALANFYYGTQFAEQSKLDVWNEKYKAAYPDRTPGPWTAMGVPTTEAIIAAFEKAGRDVTRESFIDALETLTIDTGVFAGPNVFGKDRRDSFRTVAFIKFDGTTATRFPSTFTWDGSTTAP